MCNSTTPQDEIDKGIFCLFANKSNHKELFEALQKTIKNRENNNSDKFKNLNGSIFGINVKFRSIGNFEDNYQVRKGKFAILREIMRAIIQRVIEEYNWLIFGIHQQELESADEVYELLSQEVSRLQELYVKCTCLNRENNRIRKKGPTSFFQSSFQLLEEENEENLVGPI
ncbi:hypothetical protein Glove_71g83 [Diversispora epigaea]|uniref:Uncharacterized protein n=1 Tax=Diversispora epigaea TaxID=1348612 RepID=A0A397JJ14_9GLOM|nr:hypothetical protein Glove_71g83 [Diversispora epigaea]